MTDKKNDKTILGRFALKGPSGLVGLIIVALIAFSLGALFLGGEESSMVGDQTVEEPAKPEVWTCSMHP